VSIHIHSQIHGKLDSRVVKCIFLGYASNKKDIVVTILRIKSLLPPWVSLLRKLNSWKIRF